MLRHSRQPNNVDLPNTQETLGKRSQPEANSSWVSCGQVWTLDFGLWLYAALFEDAERTLNAPPGVPILALWEDAERTANAPQRPYFGPV